MAQAPDQTRMLALSRERYVSEVDRLLDVPAHAQAAVVSMLDEALSRAGLPNLPVQHVLVVDRSPQVQAAFLLLRTPEAGWLWVGASPVSTGRVGSFDHFRTPQPWPGRWLVVVDSRAPQRPAWSPLPDLPGSKAVSWLPLDAGAAC